PESRCTECELWRRSTKAEEPDVARAWQLVDELRGRTPAPQWPFVGRRARLAVAAVLARASLADSARHVLVASRGNPEIDPARDLVYNEAFVRTLLGDRDEELQLLRVVMAANRERRVVLGEGYQWGVWGLRAVHR